MKLERDWEVVMELEKGHKGYAGAYTGDSGKSGPIKVPGSTPMKQPSFRVTGKPRSSKKPKK